MVENEIYSINGPVVKVRNATTFSMLEKVVVGNRKLMGEVISVSREFTTIQVYRRPDYGRENRSRERASRFP